MNEPITYTVHGYAAFPIAMLMRAEAWPATEDDIKAIVASLGPTLTAPRYLGKWSIKVSSLKPPTVAEWKSFDCAIEGIDDL